MNASNPYLVVCDLCNGSGDEPPEPQRNTGGYGRHVVTFDPNPCQKCNGRGRVLTDDGKVVKEVVEHVVAQGR